MRLAVDIRSKAQWVYESCSARAVLKTLLSDGTAAMVYYRLMQWSRRWHLVPLEMLCNKLNAVCCNCIIGRGAEFGPGLVLIHSTGIVINGMVRGGSNIYIEHQVTIGAERRNSPVLGDDVFIGAGAKIIGAVTIGNGARIGANAVVVDDVPPYATVAGIPARVVRLRKPTGTGQQNSGLDAQMASAQSPGAPTETASVCQGLPGGQEVQSQSSIPTQSPT